ncbi:hypothetical protein ACFQY7_27215 [Actinomadura luteofluorescens]|uniref:hypothetical protein n=1 Tax=Actinomadura luteofluorescens TaxID=46163 RepID=UPI0036441AB0
MSRSTGAGGVTVVGQATQSWSGAAGAVSRSRGRTGSQNLLASGGGIQRQRDVANQRIEDALA